VSPIKHHLGHRGSYTAQKIKPEILPVAQNVLDVIPENPQEPHISEDVHPAAVKKHRGQNRGVLKVIRHQPVDTNESITGIIVQRESKRNTRILMTISSTVITGLE